MPPLCITIVLTEALGLEGKIGSCTVIEASGITTSLVEDGIIPPDQLFSSFQSELGVPCHVKFADSLFDKNHGCVSKVVAKYVMLRLEIATHLSLVF